ncbi:pilus assembly protein PilW [Pseudomonas sichuanensis]|uniref:PilW family protein n=1 Tax=Pseudomonas TaxID=286 RepID=UPI00244858ED|nr:MULTISPECIES: pilus assembly protein PilW [Pseudomonas]MDH0729145.1 pilus assembly protein PilW [Pseudomonas sichuanensis]MDH1586018.1 pilus assembly protein PilW [Pseudomonas sichuanensis]MDH1595183.1 pilus assembly protein PilW [Pseudomonas sichuanensis]MDH1596126.1 pilus assembly protein PilW [Pseudomonas sichuanensis]MDU9404558.1 pilus assembly protein PilW [Pseudomonas sp. zfem004]
MTRRQTGVGLTETMLALALGLMLLAAASQVFGSAYQAWRLQGATARMQDDARLVLQRMAEDIRMAGMFGCLRLEPEDFRVSDAAQAFANPIQITPGNITLVGAALPGLPGPSDWTVLGDCSSWAHVMGGQHVPAGDLFALPVRRLVYQLRDGSLLLLTKSQNARLIDNVRALELSRVGQRVDIRLILYDRQHQLEQQHQISVAVRNPQGDA